MDDNQFFDSLRKKGEEQAQSAADDAMKKSTKGWLARADSEQKFALYALGFALAIGPLGQGVVAATGGLFKEASVPSTQQLKAVGWLFLIAAPVAFPVLTATLMSSVRGRGAQYQGRTILFAAAFAALLGAGVAGGAQNNLAGDVYCYAEAHGLQVTYEKECRAFNTLGFDTAVLEANQKTGNPYAKAGSILMFAAIFTIDARGAVMVIAAVIAAYAVGYLIRREYEAGIA
jgi:hypothetical protein